MYRFIKYFLSAGFLTLSIFSLAQTDTLQTTKKDTTEYVKTDMVAYVQSPADTSNSNLFFKKKRGIDSRFIQEYPDYLNIGPYISAPYMTLDMAPLTDSLGKFGSQFEGNFSGLLGFNFGYRCIGLSYGVRIPVDPNSIGTMGKSSNRVLTAKIYKLPFIISLDYRRYSGFYDANTKAYDSSVTNEKPYYIRPDLTFRTYSANIICNFSWRRYSFSAPVNYADRQVRTRIGFLLRGTVSYAQLFSDSSFISNYQINYFPDFYRVRSIDAFVVKSGPGMGMNLVFFKKMYLSLTFFLMINNVMYRYTDEVGKMTPWKYDVNCFLQGGAALGYNSERFYIGFRIGGDNNVMRIQGADIQTRFGNASLDVGYRFNTPGIFKRAYENTLTKYFNL